MEPPPTIHHTAPTPTATGSEANKNPFQPDSELGNLEECFNSDKCCLATDKEVKRLNSRVVVFDPKWQVQHTVHHGRGMELYVMDLLRECPHSFKNGPYVPDPRTSQVVEHHYPQQVGHFTNDVSVTMCP
jgi:hypothetical protein